MLARQEARRGRRGEGRELTTGFGLALAGALQPRCRTDPGRHVWSPARPQATLLPPLDADPGAHPRGPAAHVAAPLGPPGGRGAPREVAQAPPAPRRFPGSTLDREAASPRPPAAPAAPPLPARDLQAGARPATAVPPSRRPAREGSRRRRRGRRVAGRWRGSTPRSPAPPRPRRPATFRAGARAAARGPPAVCAGGAGASPGLPRGARERAPRPLGRRLHGRPAAPGPRTARLVAARRPPTSSKPPQFRVSDSEGRFSGCWRGFGGFLALEFTGSYLKRSP